MEDQKRAILLKSIIRIFFPILKLCLKNAVRYQEIAENLKISMIKAAQKELEDLGEKSSVSKISAMTGINRKEVKRLFDSEFSLLEMKDVATKVIGQWQNDPKFTTKAGKPKALTAGGVNSEFFSLVKKVSSDLAPYTILHELERLNIIERSDDKVTLSTGNYSPGAEKAEEGFAMLGEDISDLIAAVQDNIFSGHAVSNLHLKTEYTKIPVDEAEDIRKWLLLEGSAFHKKVRDYLSNYDLDINPSVDEEKESIRVSYASFSYTEQK